MNIQNFSAEDLLALVGLVREGKLKSIVLTIEATGVDIFITPIPAIKYMEIKFAETPTDLIIESFTDVG